MRLVVLNGSPRETGAVATLLRAIAEGAGRRYEIEWVDVYDLQFRQCRGCTNCRPDGQCCIPEDDAHRVGRAIRDCDGLAVGTPTHWGNMSAPLKGLFDRLVPVCRTLGSECVVWFGEKRWARSARARSARWAGWGSFCFCGPFEPYPARCCLRQSSNLGSS